MNATEYRKKLGYGFEESFEAAEREVRIRELQERMEKHQRQARIAAKRPPMCKKKVSLVFRIASAFGL